MHRAAQELVKPARVLYVVVGDRAKVEAGIRQLQLGPIQLLDPDGKPLAP